tara:strand:+ start:40 stop:360 length:321 start_codon:yes stop_codon:yes gene_type:complete
MINQVLLYIITIVSGMALHELGHIIILQLCKTPYKITWEKGIVIKYDDFKITSVNESRMIFSGIIMGALPVVIIGYVYFNVWEFIGIAFFYLLGINHDVKALRGQT